jgi:peptidoglycan hydrolase CwlO-like protein
MEAMEVVAVIILIVAIAVLVYYYLLNSPATMDKLRSYVPTSADAHMDEVLNNNSSEYSDLSKEEPSSQKGDSMGKRIKVKLSDIDMSALNTDAFSNKIDAFLDAKSEELIKDWSLATTEDLEDLQTKFSETTNNVDNLEKDFNEFKKSSEEFQKSTEEKLNDLDKRIESLENN